jgi:hypothetical protein
VKRPIWANEREIELVACRERPPSRCSEELAAEDPGHALDDLLKIALFAGWIVDDGS